MPPVTRNLVIANIVIFLVEMAAGDAAIARFALWPIGGDFAPWQLVTYAFLHASVTHVLFNMLGLYSFGSDLERVWGPRRFLIFYFTCAISAGLTQLVFSAVTGAQYPTVGASGAVFGLFTCSISAIGFTRLDTLGHSLGPSAGHKKPGLNIGSAGICVSPACLASCLTWLQAGRLK